MGDTDSENTKSLSSENNISKKSNVSNVETSKKSENEIIVIPPDVSLTVDGFGFCPRVVKILEQNSTKKYDKPDKDKTNSTQELEQEETSHKSNPSVPSAVGSINTITKPQESSLSIQNDKKSDSISQKIKSDTQSVDETDLVIVKRFTWVTKNRLTVQLITYGATITAIHTPDRHGVGADIVMGFEKIEDYLDYRDLYFGSTIGRVANYLKDGFFVVGKDVYCVDRNKGDHHFNGGFRGFDKVNWEWTIEDETCVILSYFSHEGECGYPGNLLTQMKFQVTVDNTLRIQMRCYTTHATAVNLSNQLYFNLAGHHAGQQEIENHVLTINADKYIEKTDENLPTGVRTPVGGSIYDFRIPRLLGDLLPIVPTNGYDANFCITKGADQDVTFVSRVVHPKSGRVLEMYTNQPGLHFSTCNNIPDCDIIREGIQDVNCRPIIGKNGALYKSGGAISLQTQNFPNAPQHKNFPCAILQPGQQYVHEIIYKFGLQLGKYC